MSTKRGSGRGITDQCHVRGGQEGVSGSEQGKEGGETNGTRKGGRTLRARISRAMEMVKCLMVSIVGGGKEVLQEVAHHAVNEAGCFY